MNGLLNLERDRRLDEEDLQIQFEAVTASVRKGFFSSAIAELRGAMVILEGIRKRREG